MSLVVPEAHQQFQHILRLLNTNVDGKRKIMYALTEIKGVGRRYSNLVCKKADVDLNKRAGDLNSDELERLVTIIQNPTQFKIPTWFLNRQKDIIDGKNSQILSNGVDSKLRDDLERLKKIRAHRGLRHYWGLRVRGQHTKTTGRRGKTVGVSKKRDFWSFKTKKKNISYFILFLMATPGKPRQSGIPARSTAIPTPSRSRSSSFAQSSIPPLPSTIDPDIERALAEAIKANDPSAHRLSPQSSAISNPPLLSGRRSVNASRPQNERSKTPTFTRSVSRPASRASMAPDKPPRSFDIGDNVRIESLGFEGILRYMGDIDGKPGLWAGVELSGGFYGKGKNDGSVAGKRYFTCPPNCGVFVASTKLSASTVGNGSFSRPSSVASVRNGRTTPANSGRITPSISTTRTPSATIANGRRTPSTSFYQTPTASSAGRVTPASKFKYTAKTPTVPTKPSLSEKITPGSRASKYATMTAQQLSSRKRESENSSPHPRSNSNESENPQSIARSTSSPSRITGSPFSTPRATKLSQGLYSSPSMPSSRTSSTGTPRARVPSDVAMPPPPSPNRPLRLSSVSLQPDDLFTSSENGGQPSASLFSATSHSRPSSSASLRSSAVDDAQLLERLQSRLEAAEYENERLRAASTVERDEATSISKQNTSAMETLQQERDHATERLNLLQEKHDMLENTLSDYSKQVDGLQADQQQLMIQLAEAKAKHDQMTKLHEDELQDRLDEVKSLQDLLVTSELQVKESEALLQAQTERIEQLELQVERMGADFDADRRELDARIEELRIAGQETIALYEERLSLAQSQRYDLENRIAVLEAAKKAEPVEVRPAIPNSATQIDNEALQEQVTYLQKTSTRLEEQLEDARAGFEREMASYQDKFDKMRFEEEQRKKEFMFKVRELEQLSKSEASARARVEEIEEALRESTVALENARSEVETLSAELANLDLLVEDDQEEGDMTSRLSNFIRKVNSQRVQAEQEVHVLRQEIRQLHEKRGYDSMKEPDTSLQQQLDLLQSRLSDKDRQLVELGNEIEILRKKQHREMSGVTADKATKSEPAREEVTGLKHIIQELQKENVTASQQIKLLESENSILASEAQQLRQEVQVLEENLDHSLDHSDAVNDTVDGDAEGLRRMLKDQRIRFEAELDQTRKRISELEMKHARAVHDHNKEVSELEALVESKNVPPPSEQPHPDSALLNTTPPSSDSRINISSKVNLVAPDFKDRLEREESTSGTPNPSKRRVHSNNGPQSHKPSSNAFTREKCASGLLALVNVGIFGVLGRTFVLRPQLQRDTAAILSTVGGSIALLAGQNHLLNTLGIQRFQATDTSSSLSKFLIRPLTRKSATGSESYITQPPTC
ncbi:hypothetical protein CVT24_009725 [Panaeolus cyanescens]|uniref:CAP-Gly domain-containing protein n=1 Tax=Panaeolus cyanescens TaxID=181874 RepID=A0A409Y9E1_9AGAR|nr:hypothetical protein CVT24_009725 [Panaeolus cyanescens]